VPPYFRFGERPDADRKAIPFGEVAIVGLMLLNKDVVTSPDGGDQGES
jgi:hypothetical protein